MPRPLIVTAVALAAATAACGGGGSSSKASTSSIVVQVGSYDIAANRPQALLVGLQEENHVIGYGRANFDLRPKAGGRSFRVPAAWTPVAGQSDAGSSLAPQLLTGAPSGVYRATTRFPTAGQWLVTVDIVVGGKRQQTTAAPFEVLDRPKQISVGDVAPKTVNRLPGSQPETAVDSRATAGQVPDPLLHQQTVAQAIATQKPTMVVISTPVFCVSRFCGPVTDSVSRLAGRYGKQMNFVHIEVWRDYDKHQVNKAAAAWIFRDPNGDLNEPWVFVVNGRGRVTQRFDNVVSDTQLSSAVTQALTS